MSLVEKAVDRLKQIRGRNLSRAAKACFCDGQGQLTREGEILLADMRNEARLFDSAVRRNAAGAVDKDSLLEIEGRRQLLLRLLNLLELDPLGIARLREVDDAN